MTCTCSHYEIDKKTVPYEATAELSLEIETSKQRDSWSAYAWLKTNDKFLPYPIIQLKGNAREACLADPEIVEFTSDSIMDWGKIRRTIEFNFFIKDREISEEDITINFVYENVLDEFFTYKVEGLTFQSDICKANIELSLTREKIIPIITQGFLYLQVEKAGIEKLVPFVISPPQRFSISPFPIARSRIHDVEIEFKEGGIDWRKSSVGYSGEKTLVKVLKESKDALCFKAPEEVNLQTEDILSLVDFEVMYRNESVIVSVPFY